MRGLSARMRGWRAFAAERPYLATCAAVMALGAFSALWTITVSSTRVVGLGATWLVVVWGLQAAVMATFVAVVLARPADSVAQALVAVAVLIFVTALCGGIVVEPDRYGPLSARMMLVVVAGGVLVTSWPLQAATAALSVGLWALTTLTVAGTPPMRWADWPLSWVLAVVLSGMLVFITTGERRQTREVTGRLRRAALVDALTGVHNRAGLVTRGRDVVAAAAATRGRISCFFIDVDGMKEINDSHGHAAGDHLLAMVARALSAVTRDVDVVGRWGGDEFLVVSPGRWRDPEDLAARVQESLDHDPRLPEWWRGGVDVVSVGGATRLVSPADAPAAVLDALIAEADAAMYRLRGTRRS